MWVAVAAATLTALGCTADRAPEDSRVETTAGIVQGVAAKNHRTFLGIPYAAPPTGPLRWRPPQPVNRWEGVRQATEQPPRCMQSRPEDAEFTVSEDCLTLDVWTPPRRQDGELRPVLVWIPGGGFVDGGADLFDGQPLATGGDIVVVVLNYRLGSLGFLAHPALSEAGQVGNYGLLDQQAALRWVQDNIAEFGGDPSKVTLGGESAGAMSVCDHLVAPGSVGLFRAAIMQSGPCQAQADLLTAQRISVQYGVDAGCPDTATAADCLRGLPVSALAGPLEYAPFGVSRIGGPVTASPALPTNPFDALQRGEGPPIPMIVGTNHDEFTLFAAGTFESPDGLPPYGEALTRAFGDDAGRVAEEYPLDRFGGNALQAYSTAATDGVFACPVGTLANEISRRSPVFAYEFNDTTLAGEMGPMPLPLGAAHAFEVQYLFETRSRTPAQQTLADQMIAYWSSFVRDGVPTAPDAPAWPPLVPDPLTGQRLSLQTGTLTFTADFYADHRCGFWDSLR